MTENPGRSLLWFQSHCYLFGVFHLPLTTFWEVFLSVLQLVYPDLPYCWNPVQTWWQSCDYWSLPKPFCPDSALHSLLSALNKRISFYQSECLLFSFLCLSHRFIRNSCFWDCVWPSSWQGHFCCNISNRVISSGSTRCILGAVYCSRCWKYCGKETHPCPGGADRLVGTKAIKRVSANHWVIVNVERALEDGHEWERVMGAWALLGLEGWDVRREYMSAGGV